ncbi:cell wall-binding repeat-containing protein [Microbacterium rhizosphaerae]|uniref:Cell wall-binding repeat-containing protein n=1 Tax=Microbacterium rhizosphaerae TaxID=1678237 RepID=A0ABZ0SUG3_9MICO|nr:cell wall-binding repeat-containing protein [Microbacterium rhizosphaerae]WPR90892.1 cell wall-binding repeat-containing protein [Microbacterium rhizosphaerae]
MTGQVDGISVTYSYGPQLNVYGWTDTIGPENGNNNLVEVTLTGPDGAAVPTDIGQPLLATLQFSNGYDDHPVADSFGRVVHHGFWTSARVDKPGVYKACVQVAPGYPTPTAGSWASLGCATVTVAARVMGGAITSIGPHAGQSGLYVDGWMSDSWSEESGYAQFDVSYTDGVPAADHPAGPIQGGPYFGAPSATLSAQHPGVVGLTPVTTVIDPAPPGTYSICARFTDSTAAVSSPSSCMTATITSAYDTKTWTPPASATLGVGTSVRASPAVWSPDDAAVVDRLVLADDLTNPDVVTVLAQASPGGDLLVPPTVAGHRVCILETATVPGGVPTSLRSCYEADVVGVTVGRVSGDDRYATAAAMSRTAFPVDGPGTVYVASGVSFADALSVGPVVTKTHAGLLLTDPSGLPPATQTELARLRPARIVVVGGPAAVSDTVLAQLRGLAPAVTRIWGSDRYATSRAVVESAYPPGSSARVLVATGANYPDAEAAVPAAAALSAPILLVNGSASAVESATAAELARLGADRVTVLGGLNAISAGVASTMGSNVTVDRVAGADRYETAVAIAHLASPATSADAYIASGENFPDALAAATLLGAAPGPIYLSPRDCAPPDVVADVIRIGATTATILGGPAVLLQDRFYTCTS